MTKPASLLLVCALLLTLQGCGDDGTPTDTGAGDTATGDTATGDTSTGDTSVGDTSTGDTSTGDTGPGAMCGNSMVEAGEKCDDGNTANGDGCNPTCTLTGTVVTAAGMAGAPGTADGTGAAASFDTPTQVATDGTTAWIIDAGGCSVRAVALGTSAVTTVAGDPGNCGFADGTGAAAQFDVPQGIAVLGGMLYVTDTDNHAIRQVDPTSGAVTTVAGMSGAPGPTDGAGSAARFTEPRGIATDGTLLFVSDFGNHTIRVIDPGASFDVTTLAGMPGTTGSADGVGAAASFRFPRGIAFASGMVYVADTNNHTIRSVDPSSGLVTTIAGAAGMAGNTDDVGAAARFTSPRGVASDGASLYVADRGNDAIRQIVLASGDVTTLAGGSNGSMDGVGTAASFDGPWGVTADPMRAADNRRLLVTDSRSHIFRTIE